MTARRDTVNATHDFETTIARHIKSLRATLQISPAELDSLAEFSDGTTRRLECEELNIYASHIYRICQATGVSLDYFYEPSSKTSAAPAPEEYEKQRLLNAYMHIQDSTIKRNVFDLIETIANACATNAEK